MTSPLQLHDTMTGEKRVFVPADPDRVTLYVCGPTVYSYAHIGNARPAVVFDVLFRLLREIYGEAAVVYARNVTDVDDKISAAAQAAGATTDEIAARFAEIYRADMAALGCLRPSLEPYATRHIPAMIDQIRRLVERGSAYPAEGHVLFRVSSFRAYGELSGRSLDEMIAGARVEVAPYKESPQDFVLWKPSKPGEPVWESPWGPGRPGWHIECSAMVESELGVPIDIHGAGHDLIFPHNENEIAQACCATGSAVFSRYWMHNGFLDFGGEKMSKSLGNVALVHELAKSWPGETLRWALLKGHYRSPLDWTESLLEQSRRELDYIYGVLDRAGPVLAAAEAASAQSGDEPAGEGPDALEPLLDDLNTPLALSHLHALARRIETGDVAEAEAAAVRLRRLSGVLGLLQASPSDWFRGAGGEDRAEIEDLIRRRVEARKAKDFAAADAIRAELDARGVVVMDGPQGATWRMKDRG